MRPTRARRQGRGRACCAAAVLAAIASCAAPPAAHNPDAPPSDFALGVTTYPPDRRQRLRYIVEADDVLRAAEGDGVTTSVYPAPTRRLNRLQRAELWRRTVATGMLEPDSPWTIGSVERVEAPPEGGVVAIFVTAHGVSRHAAVPADEPAIVALLDWLHDAAHYRD